MSKQATTTLLLSSLYFVSMSSLLGYGFYLIHNQGTVLEAARVAVSEQSAKETSYLNVMRQIETTQSDRDTLATFFMSEKDTVSFIAELEQAAAAIGVTFETVGLSVVPAAGTKPAELSIDCKFGGSESAVKKFVTLLENIPYRTLMTHLLVTKKVETKGAEGQAMFKITLKP